MYKKFIAAPVALVATLALAAGLDVAPDPGELGRHAKLDGPVVIWVSKLCGFALFRIRFCVGRRGEESKQKKGRDDPRDASCAGDGGGA